jgi:hypothetical protein
MNLTRRSVLALGLVSLSPGCFGSGGQTICVVNFRDEPVTVDVTIVKTDTNETVLDEQVTLTPSGEGDTATYENVVQGGENYQITASTDGGLTNSYEWDVRRESPRLANSLHILVDADRIGIGLSSP